MTSVERVAPLGASADAPLEEPPPIWTRLPSRIATLCLVEVQRLRHDRTELYTRSIQPALWLVIFGTTISRLHAIPTGGISYLDFSPRGSSRSRACSSRSSTGSRSSGSAMREC